MSSSQLAPQPPPFIVDGTDSPSQAPSVHPLAPPRSLPSPVTPSFSHGSPPPRSAAKSPSLRHSLSSMPSTQHPQPQRLSQPLQATLAQHFSHVFGLRVGVNLALAIALHNIPEVPAHIGRLIADKQFYAAVPCSILRTRATTLQQFICSSDDILKYASNLVKDELDSDELF
ncbi:proline-rich receptor-like protein kinase PERK2 isoform X3 [Juglans regia]|uniref:Proline-rich receptor-like protein kinase PERK2 isoform X3 n=1 Tax=Juglans regia TaxID=51240 RepID=A0A6P9E6P0_JUGRE|nr:proline-rich receptor-like protein kinase PERK2 isoform X3 [Juglans regia]